MGGVSSDYAQENSLFHNSEFVTASEEGPLVLSAALRTDADNNQGSGGVDKAEFQEEVSKS